MREQNSQPGETVLGPGLRDDPLPHFVAALVTRSFHTDQPTGRGQISS